MSQVLLRVMQFKMQELVGKLTSAYEQLQFDEQVVDGFVHYKYLAHLDVGNDNALLSLVDLFDEQGNANLPGYFCDEDYLLIASRMKACEYTYIVELQYDRYRKADQHRVDRFIFAFSG